MITAALEATRGKTAITTKPQFGKEKCWGAALSSVAVAASLGGSITPHGYLLLVLSGVRVTLIEVEE